MNEHDRLKKQFDEIENREKKSALDELLDTLLREASEQRQWFDNDIKKHNNDVQARSYSTGSRDAYNYMMGKIREAKERV